MANIKQGTRVTFLDDDGTTVLEGVVNIVRVEFDEAVVEVQGRGEFEVPLDELTPVLK